MADGHGSIIRVRSRVQLERLVQYDHFFKIKWNYSSQDSSCEVICSRLTSDDDLSMQFLMEEH